MQRTKILTKLNFSGSIAFIIGPLIAFALSLEGFEVLWFHVSAYTAPGFLSGIFAIAIFALVAKFWREHTPEEMEVCKKITEEELKKFVPQG
jgi:L-lactate permease